MAKLSTRGNYHIISWKDPQTGDRHRESLGKIGVIPQSDLDAILKIRNYEESTAARILHHHRRPAPTFGDFAKRYKLWHQGEYPDSTYRVAQIIDDHLIPHFGTTPLNLLSVEQAEEFKTIRRFRVKGSSVAKEIRVLQAVINRAVDLKIIHDNPISIVQPPQQLDSKPHHWYDTTDALRALYEASQYGPTWKFMANTGVRRGEAFHLRRLWITDAVRIQSTGEERTKAGKWRKIPLSEGARKALEEMADLGMYLLPRMEPSSLSRAFAKDAARAGVGGSLHSLRHTYICRLLLDNVPIRTVQLYAGHAHISTTEKYAYQVLRNDPAAAVGMDI